jgi:hypothetical protein
MSATPHQARRQGKLNTRKALVVLAAIFTIATVVVATARRPKSIGWFPYSPAAFEEQTLEGNSVAVLYYARWTMSADPKGGMDTPTVLRTLADAGFVAMSADLTDGKDDGLLELKKQGFTALPILILYPNTGHRLGLSSGIPESEIVSTIRRIGR